MNDMETLGKLLIIDDNKDVLFALNLFLEPYAEKIKVMLSPERIRHFMTDFQPDIILLDMNFSRDTVNGEEGMDCLQDILHIDPQAVVIMMTAYSDTDKAVRTIKAGATDFISKPWENEKLLATLNAAMKLRRSQTTVNRLEERVEALSKGQSIQLPDLIGESEGMQTIMDTIEKLRDADVNVLLLGENGTGKDVIARYLHAGSNRSGEPFVTIDVGSVPEPLFESELFGYEKGAFTDARKDKKGRMEMAHEGTLFLDEVGNLSPAAQAKLLTAIEKKRIIRLGGTKEIPINVRLICATNANLHTQMQEGRFRQDLFYRINTVEIHIPPLRERDNDIQLLADHFLKSYVRKYGKNILEIGKDARAKLQKYTWPGNVRELRHAIERAVVLCNSDTLHADDFLLYAPSAKDNKPETLNLEALERHAIERAVELSEGNMSRAAKTLGITRYALYRKLEKLGL